MKRALLLSLPVLALALLALALLSPDRGLIEPPSGLAPTTRVPPVPAPPTARPHAPGAPSPTSLDPTPAPAPGAAAAAPQPPDDTAAPSVLPELALRLGADAFTRGDMKTAQRHFRSIVDDSPDHPMAPFAAYKLAWTEYNLGDPHAAITELQRVVTWLRDEGRAEEAVTLREAQMDLEHFRRVVDTGG